MKILKSTILIILLQLLAIQQINAADSCVNLFIESAVHESKFTLNEKDILAGPAAEFSPLESVDGTSQLFQKFLESSPLKFLPVGSRFAVNLSRFNQVHVVSEGLTPAQHNRLMTFLMVSHAERILLSVPMLFRNRYMEVTINSHGVRTSALTVVPKLAVDLEVPVTSQVITGFATKSTDKIRTYQPGLQDPAEKTRPDLLKQRLTQDTFATCGLASAIKVFNPRKVKYSERELLNIVENNGIRSIKDIFGPDPGLSLSDAAQLLQILGRRHGFTVREVKVTTPEDVVELEKVAKMAAEGKYTDVIVNYHSPGVGRPGGGHFTPLAGYNSKTKEILLGEVNLAMNPEYWTNQKTLIEAMLVTSGANEPRGYLVITWLDPLKQ